MLHSNVYWIVRCNKYFYQCPNSPLNRPSKLCGFAAKIKSYLTLLQRSSFCQIFILKTTFPNKLHISWSEQEYLYIWFGTLIAISLPQVIFLNTTFIAYYLNTTSCLDTRWSNSSIVGLNSACINNSTCVIFSLPLIARVFKLYLLTIVLFEQVSYSKILLKG